MFGWFKKRKNNDVELKARLAKSLENYVPDETVIEITDTTWTDVTINGKVLRVPKISPKAIEELTLTEFEEEVTIVGLDKTDDPWGNAPDSTQWHKAEKHGKRS